MITQPKGIINKFTGMSDKGGIFYLDGFSIENENGRMSLDENYKTSETINSNTAGYDTLGDIIAIQNIYPLTNSRISASQGYRIIMDSDSHFFTYDLFSSAYRGRVGGISASNPYLYCQKPDLFSLPSGNLIYTSSNHLGLMIRGLAKTGSSATKIIDKDGRNFISLGLSTTAPNNRVSNLKTGAEYTITAISTTTSTNDTLEFSAIGSLNNVENDEFIALVNTKWDLFKSDGTSGGTTIPFPIFKGQPQSVYWSRPIRQYGNQYMILNGNYIALLANDENTIDCSYKQLPAGFQGITFEISGRDEILVSAYDNKGQGYLLLWDGASDGWFPITKVSRPPSALRAYKNGWVYIADGSIYFTDGYTIEKLISFPDNVNLGSKYNTNNHNGIAIIDDVIYFAVSGNYNIRSYNGILVFNPNFGLSFFKCKSKGTGFAGPICLFVNPNVSISSIFSTSNDLEIGCANSLNNLNEYQEGGAGEFKSFVYFLDFEQETQIKEVWLNLKHSIKTQYDTRSQKNCKISINYGNGKQPIIKYGQVSSNTTTTATVNETNFPGVMGEEIEFINGANAGQRTFITNITNPGTSNATWTLSPAISTASATSSDIRVWSVKNGETRSLTLDDFDKPVRFQTNFIGSRMWLEVVITGVANSFPVSIDDIILS